MDIAVGLLAMTAYVVGWFGGLVIFAAGYFLKRIGVATAGLLMLLSVTTFTAFMYHFEDNTVRVIFNVVWAIGFIVVYASLVLAIAKKEKAALKAQPAHSTANN